MNDGRMHLAPMAVHILSPNTKPMGSPSSRNGKAIAKKSLHRFVEGSIDGEQGHAIAGARVRVPKIFCRVDVPGRWRDLGVKRQAPAKTESKEDGGRPAHDFEGSISARAPLSDRARQLRR